MQSAVQSPHLLRSAYVSVTEELSSTVRSMKANVQMICPIITVSDTITV